MPSARTNCTAAVTSAPAVHAPTRVVTSGSSATAAAAVAISGKTAIAMSVMLTTRMSPWAWAIAISKFE